jgi:hypothetical protein
MALSMTSGYQPDGRVPDDAPGKQGLRSLSVRLAERVRREKPRIRPAIDRYSRHRQPPNDTCG